MLIVVAHESWQPAITNIKEGITNKNSYGDKYKWINRQEQIGHMLHYATDLVSSTVVLPKLPRKCDDWEIFELRGSADGMPMSVSAMVFGVYRLLVQPGAEHLDHGCGPINHLQFIHHVSS